MGAKSLAAGTVLVYGTVYAHGISVTCDRNGPKITKDLKRGPAFPVLQCSSFTRTTTGGAELDWVKSDCTLHPKNDLGSFPKLLLMDVNTCQLEKVGKTYKISNKESRNRKATDRYFVTHTVKPITSIAVHCDGQGCQQKGSVPTKPNSVIQIGKHTVSSNSYPAVQWSSSDGGCFFIHSMDFERKFSSKKSNKLALTSASDRRSGTKNASARHPNEELMLQLCDPKIGSATITLPKMQGKIVTAAEVTTCRPKKADSKVTLVCEKQESSQDVSGKKGPVLKAMGGPQSLIYHDSTLWMFPKDGNVVKESFLEFRFQDTKILNAFFRIEDSRFKVDLLLRVGDSDLMQPIEFSTDSNPKRVEESAAADYEEVSSAEADDAPPLAVD